MTKVNWHKINECGNDNLKKAQKILNDNPKLNLSKKLFTTAIDCEMTGKPLISTLSHEVIEYAVFYTYDFFRNTIKNSSTEKCII